MDYFVERGRNLYNDLNRLRCIKQGGFFLIIPYFLTTHSGPSGTKRIPERSLV
jgi:hypothetical protein